MPKLTSNILSESEYQGIALETMNILKDTLSRSLGYYGSTTVMETNSMSRNNITKDGYTILGKIRFSNPVSRTILEAIQEVSGELVKSVGDGSTSAVLASSFFYDDLVYNLERDFKGISRKRISQIIEKIAKLAKTELKSRSIEITEDNYEVVRNIAGVSNNNDDKTGKIIYELFKQIGAEGHVSLQEGIGYNEEDRFELASGMTTAYGYIDQYYANNADGITAEFKNVAVFMFADELNKKDIDWFTSIVGSILATKHMGIVIVAPQYTVEFTNAVRLTIETNRNRLQDVNAVPIALTTYNVKRPDYIDLATYLGATIFDRTLRPEEYQASIDLFNSQSPDFFIDKYVGRADSILMDSNNTTFMNGGGETEAIEQRIESINKEISAYHRQTPNNHTETEISKRKMRMANLKGNVGTLFIAGKTQRERETRQYLIDDSISAVRSALRHGYVTGGNLTLLDSINTVVETLTDETEITIGHLLANSIASVYNEVLKNAHDDTSVEDIITMANKHEIFNLKTDNLETFEETSIINSVETDIKILESIVSIVTLLAMSNQFLTNDVYTINPDDFMDNSL